jgi:mannose-6-phosphate isomerase
VFNFAPLTAAELDVRVRCRPRRLRPLGPIAYQDELIGPNQTDCFRVLKSAPPRPDREDRIRPVIAIVTSRRRDRDRRRPKATGLRTYDKVFLPAGLGPVEFTPEPAAEILECLPPA